jgi:hypothetical protein
MKDKIMTSLAKEDGIFKKIECEVMDILEKDIVPQIMGCLRTCPRCSMKCRLGLNHVGGH